MSGLPHGQQKATCDPHNLDSYAICDVSGVLVNHSTMRFQDILAGDTFVNTGLLVAPGYYDIPNEQDRALRIPPDPVPIKNPRPPSWVMQEAEP